MIKLIKAIHTTIWAVMVAAIMHLLYAGITGNINWTLWISFGLMVLEGLALLIFKGSCPFTLLAKKSKPDYKDGDDLLVPKWLLNRNKEVFGTILAIALLLIAIRLIF